MGLWQREEKGAKVETLPFLSDEADQHKKIFFLCERPTRGEKNF
jgi:hypothetical protein